MMKKSYFFLLFALAILMLPSCLEVDPPVETAPDIPPAELYVMPTTVLQDTNADTTSGTSTGTTYHNWVYAGINLVFWHTAVVLNSAIPTTAFGLALNEDPVYLGNGMFEWTYQHQAAPALGGKTYDVRLTAEYINSNADVEWIMTVSEVGGFQDFEWYRGISSLDFSEAHFTVNHKPNNPQPYLDIDYQRNAANTNATLRYTNVNTNSNDMGRFIEYRVNGGNQFNRAFDIGDGSSTTNGLIEIQWTEPTKEGRVKSLNRFGDTDWHCWDSNQADTDC